jgi:hypothetical protein
MIVGVVLVAAGCGGTVAGNRVMTSYDTLASKVVACAQAHTKSTSDAQDSAARQVCEDRLQSCGDAAKPAVKALADAISACTDSDRRCRNDAGSADASVASCEEKLQACLGAAHPQGTDGGPAASGSKCVDDLHTCVQAGTTPLTCARDVAQCVLDSVPTPDAATLEPRDGGHRSEDAGVNRDAGRADAAPAHPDAGTTNKTPPTSSGPSSMGTDAARPMDAGESKGHDAATPKDAGEQSSDAACDAGMRDCPDGSHGACGKQHGKCPPPGQ